jgi:hypothetical protein
MMFENTLFFKKSRLTSSSVNMIKPLVVELATLNPVKLALYPLAVMIVEIYSKVLSVMRTMSK